VSRAVAQRLYPPCGVGDLLDSVSATPAEGDFWYHSAMSLNAFVCCDCFETGNLKTQPNPQWEVHVDADGSRAPGTSILKEQLAFERWSHTEACAHENGVLLHHRIGNIALVECLREQLQRYPDRFPLLLGKVVYNGVHAGDFIEPAEVERVKQELKPLAQLHSEDGETERFLRDFARQLKELIECATRVWKPIAF
jgi:hypothetical protein